MGRHEVIVLDTHVVVWWLVNSPRLSPAAREEIDREHRVLIPDIVCWEMAQLALRRRVQLADTPDRVMRELLAEPGVFVQPITPEIGRRAAELEAPSLRLDPADQLIAATALELRCPLVTADERLKALPGLETLW